MKHIGVVIDDRGSAIVTVEHDGDQLLAVAIERLPFSLSAVADRVGELDPEARVVIDADGLGSALWHAVGPPEDADRWTLYSGRGIERQQLVDTLLVTIHQGRSTSRPTSRSRRPCPRR